MSTKTKWEYCVLQWRTAIVSSEEAEKLHEQFPHGLMRPFGDGQMTFQVGTLSSAHPGAEPERIGSLIDTIERLGLEGWELVTHGVSPEHDMEKLFFKRPMD